MNNLTITVDPEALAWARTQAADRNVSLSRFVGDMIREQMRHSREYREAMKAAMAFRPVKVAGRPLKREELYALPRRLR